MRIRAQQIFGRLDPHRIIADLNLPIEDRDGMLVTPHSREPEHFFEIQSRELVGLTYHSPTPACNLFDFLALHSGDPRRTRVRH